MDTYIKNRLEFPWKNAEMEKQIKREKKKILNKSVKRRIKKILEEIFKNVKDVQYDYKKVREDICYCCGNGENCHVNEYKSLTVDFILSSGEKHNIVLVDYPYNRFHNRYNEEEMIDKMLILDEMSNFNAKGDIILEIGEKIKYEAENISIIENKCIKDLTIHDSIIQFIKEEGTKDDLENLDWIEKYGKCKICNEYVDIHYDHKKKKEIYEFCSSQEIYFNRYYPSLKEKFNDLLNSKKDLRKIYNNYPIIYVKNIILLLLASKRFDPSSSLCVLPMDIIKLIGGIIWEFRYDYF